MPYIWPESIVEQARDLAAQGFSANQAASQIPGMTRNGILGLGFRRGFQFFGKGGVYTDQSKPRAVQEAKPRKPRQATRPRRATSVKIEIIYEEPRMVTLMELGDDECKFPLGDPLHESFRYCGAHRVFGRSYCGLHCRASYETPQERERARKEQRRPGSSGFFSVAVRHGASK